MPPKRPAAEKEPIKAIYAGFSMTADALSNLMLDAGVTLPEMCELLRTGLAQNAADRLTKELGRVSKSRIAVMTGLSRAEIARILKLKGKLGHLPFFRHPISKIFTTWATDPRFSANGFPAALPIFGKRSFQKLVSVSNSGIPVRAMLDQLDSMKLIRILPGQVVKASTNNLNIPHPSTNSASSLARKVNLLNGFFRHSLQDIEQISEFYARADIPVANFRSVEAKLTAQISAFVVNAQRTLDRHRLTLKSTSTTSQALSVRVSAFCFQSASAERETRSGSGPPSITRRKNLRRIRSR